MIRRLLATLALAGLAGLAYKTLWPEVNRYRKIKEM